jgi:hypothetical protein
MNEREELARALREAMATRWPYLPEDRRFAMKPKLRANQNWVDGSGRYC